MKIFEKLYGMFGTKADPFKLQIEALLLKNDIRNVRAVGGIFDLNAPEEISEPLFQKFTRVGAFLSDKPDGRAVPFLAGITHEGNLRIASLANYARPDDIVDRDRFDARRMAHQGRERLHVFGTQVMPEYQSILNP